MFLIERLWIDTLENRDAYGFKPIGVVINSNEALRIVKLEHVKKSDYSYPLDLAHEFKGSTVPRFRATELKDLSGLSLEELKKA